jgi:hypothetical protein
MLCLLFLTMAGCGGRMGDDNNQGTILQDQTDDGLSQNQDSTQLTGKEGGAASNDGNQPVDDAATSLDKITTPPDAISCTLGDDGIDPCPEGWTCDYSLLWPKGGERAEPTGDFTCHRNCKADADCPAPHPACVAASLTRGDMVIESWFCR